MIFLFLVLNLVLLRRDGPHEDLVRKNLLHQHELVLMPNMNHAYLSFLLFPGHIFHLRHFLGPTYEHISSMVLKPIMVSQLKPFVHFFFEELVLWTEKTLVKLAFFENRKAKKTSVFWSLVFWLFLFLLFFKLLL